MLLVAGCVVSLTLACFAPVLLRDEQFSYRDAGDFYYPLYQRVQQEWEAGRWPLWEPEENGGMPLLGNPVAAVLYPGKILYALPYAWGARLYVIAHVLLAFAAMRILLRSWGVSGTGSCLGSLAYAFGAPVLAQYANVIFLVGAAWRRWPSGPSIDWSVGSGDGPGSSWPSSWCCRCWEAIPSRRTSFCSAAGFTPSVCPLESRSSDGSLRSRPDDWPSGSCWRVLPGWSSCCRAPG